VCAQFHGAALQLRNNGKSVCVAQPMPDLACGGQELCLPTRLEAAATMGMLRTSVSVQAEDQQRKTPPRRGRAGVFRSTRDG
jgi:hypothetical protein